MADSDHFLVVGRVSGVFGVRGWVKIYSETQPRANILNYSPWFLRQADGRWQPLRLLEGRPQGKGIVARLEGCEERDHAFALVGQQVAIAREQLSELAPGEYYWADLIDLEVVTTEGTVLGRVDHLMETGANDVLVVKGDRERLIPFVPEQVVTVVDIPGGRLTVDWDPDF